MARLKHDPQVFGGYVIRQVLRGGAVHKARVLVGERDGTLCIIKDLSAMHPLLRFLYGRRMLGREARALEKLDDFRAAPRLLQRFSKDAIAIEWIDSKYKYLRSKISEDSMPRVLAALQRTVDELHARGFVHLDLRQRKNILVPTDDEIVFVDFESCRDVSGFFKRRFLLPLLAPIDRAAVLKWKAKYTPHLVTAEEQMRAARYYRWKVIWPWKKLGTAIRRLFGSDSTR